MIQTPDSLSDWGRVHDNRPQCQANRGSEVTQAESIIIRKQYERKGRDD
jgi:hypothetical protein